MTDSLREVTHDGRVLRINFIDSSNPRTANPPGWLPYEGSRYTGERGYGWLHDMPRINRDRGPDRPILLPDGTVGSTSGRPELSSFQGTHRENAVIVFRVDLPDGWYRVACTSVDPGITLPVVDVRSFKCRSHNAVFAGPRYGPPLRVPGRMLVEGQGLVEVTEGHLRIVVGDPAYAGWVAYHPRPWWQGWPGWFARNGHYRHAENWRSWLTRVIDPGFHTLRLNSLVIEPAEPPAEFEMEVLYRDYFNRDDAADVNAGISVGRHWRRIELPGLGKPGLALQSTALRLRGSRHQVVGSVVVQEGLSPAEGVVRYTTSVSVCTGEGSRAGSGRQEAGLLLLANPQRPNDDTGTFVGVVVGPRSGVAVRSGNPGLERHSVIISAAELPFDLVAGEYEILVEHDVTANFLRRIVVNGYDISSRVATEVRRPPHKRGRFGVRAVLDPMGSAVALAQFFWFYRVDKIGGLCGTTAQRAGAEEASVPATQS